MSKTVLITGSGGLIGSEAVEFFIGKGFKVIGIDNDMRAFFFGEEASTKPQNRELLEKYPENYILHNVDIRNYDEIFKIFSSISKIDLIIHTAAQCSHDWATEEPLTDFSVNATGTLNLLEATRKTHPDAVFIISSTNKVYGDNPNKIPLIDIGERYDYNDDKFFDGIDETMSIDNTKHSLFGVSKTYGDLITQEYGKYFGLKTGIFRGGCLTGGRHKGVEQHGFLSYLIRCMVEGKSYNIYGDGLQVRDNIHSSDVVGAFYEFYKNPRASEVYNIGGTRDNSVSILEVIKKVNLLKKRDGKELWSNYTLNKEAWREGDHLCYISDMGKFKRDYPDWSLKYSIDDIIEEMYNNFKL